MPFLVPILIRTGLSSRMAKIAAWVIPIVLVIVLILGAVLWIEHKTEERIDDAVQADRDAVSVEVQARQLNAERDAVFNQAVRDAAFSNQQRELEREVEQKGSDTPVGGATAAVIERMRKQQEAGRR